MPKKIAAKELSTEVMQSAQSALLSHIHRDETVKLSSSHERLTTFLKARAAELEAESILSPHTVTDWLALELFAKDRKRFDKCCQCAKQENDPIYRIASSWIARLRKK